MTASVVTELMEASVSFNWFDLFSIQGNSYQVTFDFFLQNLKFASWPSCVSPGGSLPQRVQTSALACIWRTGRGRGRKRRICRKWCPASATTPTWCPRTARWPASGQECVSEPPPTSQSHFVGSNYPSYTSTLSSSLLADVLRFDNTYSIFQAKRLSFTVEVLLPDNMQSPKANGGVQEPTTSSWDQQQQSSTLLIMWPNLFKNFNVYFLPSLWKKIQATRRKKKIQVTIHYYRKEIFFKASISSFKWKFQD